MIIDTHQHFWNYNVKEYGWIDESMAVLKRNFLPQDLAQVYTENNVDGCIAVQARQTLQETQWLLDMARVNPFIMGVVGWVDLCSEQVDEQLEAFAESDFAVGVRHVLHDEPDERYMLKDDFLRGISLLEKYGLVYDVLIFPGHLPFTCELVKMFPGQQFVLDHIAKPLIKDKVISPWDKDIAKLAEFPNIACKVSGMVTEADWQNWSVPNFIPYLDVVFNSFGIDRIMFGSDWPVCTVTGEYKAILNIVNEFSEQFSQDEQVKIFAENAKHIYNLNNTGV